MKKIFLFAVAIVIAVKSFAQVKFEKNYPSNIDSFYPDKTDKAQPMYNTLSDAYDVKFYGIDLEADNNSVYLEGNVTIVAVVTANELDTFVVELHPEYTIDSIKVNGYLESFVRDYDDVIVPLSSVIPESDQIEVQIYYHGAINESYWTGIMHDEFYMVTYTLTEPLYAKDWFPCKQVLTDKADSAYIFVTTDESLKVGSNGLLTDVVPVGGGKVRHEWKTYYPIAYYLISIAIGDYLEYNIYAKPDGLEDSILIQNYIYDASTLAYYKEDIDMTAELIEIFSELFGMYPFKEEKYGHCMAPIGGGMEHQTMTTIAGFDFMLVAHELSHMWFGDFVTCGTWQDIFINEGFATYAHLLALEQLNGEFPEYEMLAYHDDQLNSAYDESIYIPEYQFDIDYTREMEVYALTGRIFDWFLSYEKGAVILHMLRYELQDDDMFFTILRTYLSQFQFGNALGTDFQAVVENISGKDFTDFFNQWYFGEGFPVYDIQWFQENDTVYIRSVQTTSSSVTYLFKMNMDYRLVYSGDESIVRLYQEENEQIHKVYFPETVTRITVDPDEWLLKDIYSIRKEEFLVGPSNPQSITGLPIIYPNPFVDRLFIRFRVDETSAVITLHDTTGQVVRKIKTDAKSLEIDLSSLSKGIYFITIASSTGQITQKLSKH